MDDPMEWAMVSPGTDEAAHQRGLQIIDDFFGSDTSSGDLQTTTQPKLALQPLDTDSTLDHLDFLLAGGEPISDTLDTAIADRAALESSIFDPSPLTHAPQSYDTNNSRGFSSMLPPTVEPQSQAMSLYDGYIDSPGVLALAPDMSFEFGPSQTDFSSQGSLTFQPLSLPKLQYTSQPHNVSASQGHWELPPAPHPMQTTPQLFEALTQAANEQLEQEMALANLYHEFDMLAGPLSFKLGISTEPTQDFVKNTGSESPSSHRPGPYEQLEARNAIRDTLEASQTATTVTQSAQPADDQLAYTRHQLSRSDLAEIARIETSEHDDLPPDFLTVEQCAVYWHASIDQHTFAVDEDAMLHEAIARDEKRGLVTQAELQGFVKTICHQFVQRRVQDGTLQEFTRGFVLGGKAGHEIIAKLGYNIDNSWHKTLEDDSMTDIDAEHDAAPTDNQLNHAAPNDNSQNVIERQRTPAKAPGWLELQRLARLDPASSFDRGLMDVNKDTPRKTRAQMAADKAAAEREAAFLNAPRQTRSKRPADTEVKPLKGTPAKKKKKIAKK